MEITYRISMAEFLMEVLTHGLWHAMTKPTDDNDFQLWPNGFVWKCCVPLHPMVLLIIIPTKWLFHWGYTHFQTYPNRYLEVHRFTPFTKASLFATPGRFGRLRLLHGCQHVHPAEAICRHGTECHGSSESGARGLWLRWSETGKMELSNTNGIQTT